MSEEVDWQRLTTPHIVTSKQMVGIIVAIELVIQSIALLVSPTDWWIWQLLGFITATNLAAVVASC